MSGRQRGGNLAAWPTTCCTTTTSRRSAVSSLPLSRGTRAHSATAPRSPPVAPAATRSVGRSKAQPPRTLASEIASSSRSRPTTPSTPSTTPSPMPPNDGRIRPAERRTVMFRTNNSTRRNLAARMGSWSAAHWKTATFGWLALVLLAFAVGGQVGTKQADPNRAGPGESGRMDRILDAGFKLPADESVLIQNRSLRAGTPAFDAAVKDVVTRLARVAAVQDVRSPLDAAHGAQIAKGRRAALVEFEIRS